MTFDPKGDACLSLWASVFALGAFNFPPNASVLEIGAAEADWISPMLAVRPDLQMTCIDWRACDRPGMVVRGDVLAGEFNPAMFDAIVGISSIEHIGLGHYEQDPVCPDGDRFCMERVARWLRPGGWVYLDVPYNPRGYSVKGTKCRIYDDNAIAARLVPDGLTLTGCWYASHENAQSLQPKPKTPHPTHFHYAALLLTKAA